MKLILCFLFLMISFGLFCATISFHLENTIAINSDTWMFDTHPSQPPANWMTPHPGQAQWSYIHTYYDSFYARGRVQYFENPNWIWAPRTTSWITAVNSFPYITSVMPDTTYYLYFGDRYAAGQFRMLSFQHQNTVNPNNNWATLYQAGDRRIYGAGIFEVVKNIGTPTSLYTQMKLRITDVYYSMDVPYPNYIGTGQPIQAHGWGLIDFANSDPQWASYFNAKNGQVEFDFTSFSQVVQYGAYGAFNSDLTLKNASIVRHSATSRPASTPSQLNSFSSNKLKLDVSTGSYYWNSSNHGHDLYTNQIIEAPVYGATAGIETFLEDYYWEAGTNFDTFTAALTIDLSEIHGVDHPENLRILHRKNGVGSIWEILPTTIVSTSPLLLRASNLNSLGYFAVGSTSGNNLHLDTPGQLNISIVEGPNDSIELTWLSVPHAVYYNVYESDTPDAPESSWTLAAGGHIVAPITFWSGSASSKKFYHVKAEKY